MAEPRGDSQKRRAANKDPLIGRVLANRYQVLSLVDRGGMGKVYRAEQRPLGRSVALKVLDVVDTQGEVRERFFNEAALCSRLTHPNTVTSTKLLASLPITAV